MPSSFILLNYSVFLSSLIEKRSQPRRCQHLCAGLVHQQRSAGLDLREIFSMSHSVLLKLPPGRSHLRHSPASEPSGIGGHAWRSLTDVPFSKALADQLLHTCSGTRLARHISAAAPRGCSVFPPLLEISAPFSRSRKGQTGSKVKVWQHSVGVTAAHVFVSSCLRHVSPGSAAQKWTC